MAESDQSYIPPFPVRKKGEQKWEVVLIDFNGVKRYVICDSEERANAVARSRPLNAVFQRSESCSLPELRETIAAFEEYRLTNMQLYRNLKFLEQDMDR